MKTEIPGDWEVSFFLENYILNHHSYWFCIYSLAIAILINYKMTKTTTHSCHLIWPKGYVV